VFHFLLLFLSLIKIQQKSTYQEAGYPDRLGPSGKFVENSTKLYFLEITGYRIKDRTSNQA
jgi:hypothetical protein